MIRTKRFAFRNPHQREIKRMSLRQIKRLRLAAEGDRNILRRSPKLSLRRFAFLLRNIFQIHFAHTKPFLQITAPQAHEKITDQSTPDDQTSMSGILSFTWV